MTSNFNVVIGFNSVSVPQNITHKIIINSLATTGWGGSRDTIIHLKHAYLYRKLAL
jgi:hypothetical protein